MQDAIARAFSLESAKSLKQSGKLPTGPEAKRQFFYLDKVWLPILVPQLVYWLSTVYIGSARRDPWFDS